MVVSLLLNLVAISVVLVGVYYRGTNWACQALAIFVRTFLTSVVKVFRIGQVTLIPLHIEGLCASFL